MAGKNDGSVALSQFLLLNVVLHLIAILCSWNLSSFPSLSSNPLTRELFQILGTIGWLILFQFLKSQQQINSYLKIYQSKIFFLWRNCSIIFRLLFIVIFLFLMITNDYLRLFTCSYLSAVSINQYNQTQQHFVHYSSQHIITTGYAPVEDQAIYNQTKVSSGSSFPQNSSGLSSLRQRRGGYDSSQSILPTHVSHHPSPSTQHRPNSRPTPVRMSQKESEVGFISLSSPYLHRNQPSLQSISPNQLKKLGVGSRSTLLTTNHYPCLMMNFHKKILFLLKPFQLQ
jgi:hypothetical protein